jgi:hypothetical protein
LLKKKNIQLVCNFTHNHWSNQEKNIMAIKDVGTLIYKERMDAVAGEGMSLEEAKSRPLLYSLDCWPVNLTDDTQDAINSFIPGADRFISRMIIPAKGTGKKQINDTHAHAPFKKA